MDIERRWIENYTKELNGLSERMRLNLERAITSLDPDSDNLLSDAQNLMFTFCYNACLSAATIAAAFYDGLHTIQVGEPFGAESISSYNATATAIATAGILKDGLNDKAISSLIERLDYEIKKSAGHCVMKNAMKENGEDG